MINIVVFVWDPLPDQQHSIPSQKIVRYTEQHIETHYRMIERNLNTDFRYIVFSDRSLDLNIPAVVYKLWDKHRDLGGCFHRLQTYSVNMAEYFSDQPFVCMDLDMVITGDITDIVTREGDFVYYKMPGADGTGSRFNCGLYKFGYPGSRDSVWFEFNNNPPRAIELSKDIAGTDQGWVNYCMDLDNELCWDINDGIYDFRIHLLEKGITDLPEDAKIVMWPGPRDPSQQQWQEKYSWIKQHYC